MTPDIDTAGATLIAQLHARGQRATPQRLATLRAVRRAGRVGSHLTADQVHVAVGDEFPGVSAPTVYANLELLSRLGLVRRIDAGTGAALFDARVEPHPHAVCHGCGRVIDLATGVDTDAALHEAESAGFVAEGVQVLVVGRCADCPAA